MICSLSAKYLNLIFVARSTSNDFFHSTKQLSFNFEGFLVVFSEISVKEDLAKYTPIFRKSFINGHSHLIFLPEKTISLAKEDL